MRIESMYPPPIYGVSSVPSRNRVFGRAEEQINFRSDPVTKLSRRPPSKFVRTVMEDVAVDDIFYHRYDRGSESFRVIVNKELGTVRCLRNGIVRLTNGAQEASLPEGFVGQNLQAQTIGHTTYIVNKDRIVKMLDDTDANDIQKISHINVTSALAYGETIKVIIKNTTTTWSIEYSVPDLIESGNPEDPPDYDRADKARATNAVASNLAFKINMESGLEASYLGSTVAVWDTVNDEWLDVAIETGQGDRSAVAFNRVVENIDGIPLYAIVGTRIKVRPDPTTEKGTYYLQAERTSDIVSTGLEEVVWAESRAPDEPYKLDITTLPIKCVYDEDADEFTVDFVNWKERERGDNESVPVPEFVDNKINDIGYIQKRLVILTDDYVIMSEVDDEVNFWRQSAVTLLVNDKVAIASSAVDVDKLQHIIPHNRDLLVVASNAQFKIVGSEAITPQSVSMPLTTRYNCQTEAAPIALGNSVFLPITYGDSTGLIEYRGEKDTSQDVATAVTTHVIDYLKGKARLLTASSNLQMIALVTGSSVDSRLFIMERTEDSDNNINAWSEWVFGSNDTIVDIHFKDDVLDVISIEDGFLYIKEIELYRNSVENEVYLDDRVLTVTNGKQAALPTNYVGSDFIVVRGDGTNNPLFRIDFEQDGDVLTFSEDIGEGFVYIGKPFTSTYKPTRPFRYDDSGQAITTDRLRVGRFIVSMTDTNELFMRTDSDVYDEYIHEFNSRFVGGRTNRLGVKTLYTGDYVFPFSQDANLAEATFYCDNWLGCTINSISWEGQYYQSKGRM